MKKALIVGALLCALAGTAWANGLLLPRVAGPFIGTEITWGWPALSAGFDSGIIKGFVTKWEPLIVSGWWGFGFEGRWRLLAAWPNLKLGVGARIAVEWLNWRPNRWYWGPTGSVVWDWGPYQFYIRGTVGIEGDTLARRRVDEHAPLFGAALSIGADFNLGHLWALFNEVNR